jgi:ABC-type transporter Mla subunit MlaD
MESWQTAVVVVVALVAGTLLPVLVQLSMTLRSSRAALERTSARLDRALDAVAATAERIDRATAGLDERRIRALMESFDALARTVNQVRDSVRVASAVGAAVGPAVGAAVRAWRAGRPEEGDGEEHRDEAAGPEGAGKGETR